MIRTPPDFCASATEAASASEKAHVAANLPRFRLIRQVALVSIEGARAFGIKGSEAEARLLAATPLAKRPGHDGLPDASGIAIASGVPSLKLKQRQGGKIEMEDHDIRAALDRHWAASDANDFEAEHQIYREDAVLEYPQSGERIRGRHNIQASRFAQPSSKRFTVRRILGGADLWITELVLTYDGQPSYTVSIMEFRDGKVARETQYFGDPFEPGPSRAQWVERMR
jgi:ketosteroid isomerase-like protein